MSSARDDRGAATVLAVGLVGVLLALGGALGVVAAVVVDHRTAQSAADLAALAGAAARGEACAEAARVARSNGARLVACRSEGHEVEVDVLVPGPRWRGLGADPTARARAGPVA